MLEDVHINIVDNINLADAANEFADRKDSRIQKFGHFSELFKNSKILRTIHNICKINLTPSYFSYAYICFYFLYNV